MFTAHTRTPPAHSHRSLPPLPPHAILGQGNKSFQNSTVPFSSLVFWMLEMFFHFAHKSKSEALEGKLCREL